MPIKINLKSVALYAVYAIATVLINRAVSGVPLSLGLYFSLLVCGGNVFASAIIYLVATAINLNLAYSLCALFESLFLMAVTLIYRRAGKKMKYESVIYLIIALSPFIAFSTWTGGDIYGYFNNEYLFRSIVALLVMIFTFFCFKTVYAGIYRIYRCKLREDELFCLAVVYAVAGVGFINLLGANAYTLLSAALITFAVRLFKSPSAIICALVFSAPPAILNFDFISVTGYVIISVIALLFVNTGRFSVGVASGAAFAVYGYLTDFFVGSTTQIVVKSIILCGVCLIACLSTDKKTEEIKNKLTVKKILPQTAINLCREQTGERLYKISEVFKEIECAFCSLDEVIDENAIKKRMLENLKEKCCLNCERREKCKKTTVYKGFVKMINAGCVKGKVNLIDLPSDVTVNCSAPADVIANLNMLLIEYRKVTLDAENAKSGRQLLANQARGVSEVMKNCAVDLCRVKPDYSATEETIKNNLASNGVSCPEVFIHGEDNLHITAVICGNESAKKIIKVLKTTLKKDFILIKKSCCDGLKVIMEFAEPTHYDAAFGVANVTKSGEKVSGDTHSVIKMNEHSFLMVLSDGMGSGEYAKKVSATAISLIEAFYKAEMPDGTVLETINKLLSFNREERFACIDIAQIDLNSGKADFIKIGSPAGIIVRTGEIKVLESCSLPMGILDNLRPTVATETLINGDIVTFMSDGITSAFSSTPELHEFLQTLKPLNPQNLADRILQEALLRTHGKAEDDMTVLCTRIFKNHAD